MSRFHPDRRGPHPADYLRGIRGQFRAVQAHQPYGPLLLKPDVEGQSGHFTIDEKQRHVELTEEGHEYIESLMIGEKLLAEGESLYAATNLNLLHHVYSGLRAHIMFHRDVEYIVQDRRIGADRRAHRADHAGPAPVEGLHQAIEAKEVSIQSESQTWRPPPSRTISAFTASCPA